MRRLMGYLAVIFITIILTGSVVALLFNVRDRKIEEKVKHIDVVTLTESDVDPEIWGHNYPREYDGYKKTSDVDRTHTAGVRLFQS